MNNSTITKRLVAVALVLLSSAAVVACGDSKSSSPPASLVLTVGASPQSRAQVVETVEVKATATSLPETPAPAATEPPAATSTPTRVPAAPASTNTPQPPAASTPVPPSSSSVSPSNTSTGSSSASGGGGSTSATGSISFRPSQLVQGEQAIIYLNQPATAATARFGGLQYPMLQSGDRWWCIVGIGALADTGDAPVTITYTTPAGAQQTATSTIPIVYHNYPTERIDLDATTSQLLAPDIVNAEIAQRNQIYSTYTMQKLWSGPFVRPSKADIGDIFGLLRSYNGAPATDYHRGTDFVAFTGDPIIAAASGRVVFSGPLKVRGDSVIIDHGAGVFTSYDHLSRIDMQVGDSVKAGQQVGLTGATGLVTGPHLHWEVVIRGIEVDGQLWLQGQEIGP